MRKVKSVTYVIVILFIVLINLTKFDYQVELQDTELVLAIGLDNMLNQNSSLVKLTYLRNRIKEVEGGKSEEEGEEEPEEGEEGSVDIASEGSSAILTIEDKTYNRAIKASQKYAEKVFIGNTVKYFIIGEETARSGILREVDFLSRNYELRLNSKIFIAKGMSAEDLLKKADKDLPRKLDNIINSTVQSADLRKLSFLDVLKSLNSINKAGVIPVLEYNDITGSNEINIAGLAIFENDKLIDYLTNEQQIAYTILENDLKAISLDVKDGNNSEVSLGITNMDRKVDFEFYENNLKKIKINIHLFANIEELDQKQDLYDNRNVKELEHMAEENIKERLIDLTDISKGLKLDFLRVSDILNSRHPFKWEIMQANWNEVISQTDFEVNIDVTISRSYDITRRE